MSQVESSCCCCCDENAELSNLQEPWITSRQQTPLYKVPVVTTSLSTRDTLGTWKVRWGIGRSNYKVLPGLYAVGNPSPTATVLVSANYKFSFDMLRKELQGLNCWILVIDTKGVNVWCAAGKGTFGTEELINRVTKTKLSEIVENRKLILPQLGAPGIDSQEVTKKTGFSISFGPVRAKDIKTYLDADLQATEEMRTVKFTTWDRLVLTPIEFIAAAKNLIIGFGILFLINLFASRPFGLSDFILFTGSIITGTVLTPFLLPLIPGKAFSFKGWLLGILWTGGFLWSHNGIDSLMLTIGYLLLLPAISSYLALKFTGSSTYTSSSGVAKETRIALPLIIISFVAGVIGLFIASLTM